jgi:mRNA interferase YafQ
MRAIETTTQFRRDYKKHSTDSEQIYEFIEAIAKDQQLPNAARDHALKGKWEGYRECHIRPDLLLIYKKPDQGTLRLARIGTHSLLFG